MEDNSPSPPPPPSSPLPAEGDSSPPPPPDSPAGEVGDSPPPPDSPTESSPFPSTGDLSDLLQIKASLGDPASLSSWTPGSNPCAPPPLGWAGVTCDGGGGGGGGTITGLDLSQMPGIGTLNGPGPGSGTSPDGAFTHLPLPPFLQSGPLALTSIDVSNGGWAGDLPPSWTALTALTSLRASNDTELTGGLPLAWSALTTLQELHVSSDPALSGSLPDAYSSLTQLTSLNVSHDMLTGTLPPGLSTLSLLASLNVSGNQLDGPLLPPEWSSLTTVTMLDISSNPLITGGIPTDIFSALTALVQLNLSACPGEMI